MINISVIIEIAIVLAGGYGLFRHSGIVEGELRKQMFVYYTNQSNLLVVLFFLFRLIGRIVGFEGNGFLQALFFSDFSRFAIMMAIMLTFLIYHFLLAPRLTQADKESAEFKLTRKLSNYVVHYIVPLLTFADWLLFAEKTHLVWLDAVRWIIIPSVYSCYALIRGHFGGAIEGTESKYPYYFMDPDKIGVKQTAINMCMICVAFSVLGVCFIFIGRLF